LLESRHERDTVLLPALQLLPAAHEQRRHHLVRELVERVPDDRSVVLPVDDGDDPHATGPLRLPLGEAELRRRVTPLAAGCCARVAWPYSFVLSCAPPACLLCH